MITPDCVELMARYNRWMNEKIYAACEELSDKERKADRGAFFKSVHSTLNHLAWGDAMWLGRFTKSTPLERAMPTVAGNVELYADWSQLKEARVALDEELLAWSATLSQAWLANDFTWYSGITKTTRNGPAWQAVAHMFNHQVHHRGQVTTLLSQQKIEFGATDLMMMPNLNSV